MRCYATDPHDIPDLNNWRCPACELICKCAACARSGKGSEDETEARFCGSDLVSAPADQRAPIKQEALSVMAKVKVPARYPPVDVEELPPHALLYHGQSPFARNAPTHKALQGAVALPYGNPMSAHPEADQHPPMRSTSPLQLPMPPGGLMASGRLDHSGLLIEFAGMPQGGGGGSLGGPAVHQQMRFESMHEQHRMQHKMLEERKLVEERKDSWLRRTSSPSMFLNDSELMPRQLPALPNLLGAGHHWAPHLQQQHYQQQRAAEWANMGFDEAGMPSLGGYPGFNHRGQLSSPTGPLMML